MPSVHTEYVCTVLNSVFNCFIPSENVLKTSLENIGAIFHPSIVLFNAAAIEREYHFYFRGADDISYVVSAYIAAKIVKLNGVRTIILQNMLNTPKYTWVVQDMAKSRVMLKLVKSSEDNNFRMFFQPRAGLDFFLPMYIKQKFNWLMLLQL